MRVSVFLVIILFSIKAFSQDDLLDLVTEKKDEGPKRVYATFKTYHLCNAQTIETVKKRNLDFRIFHRFGNIYNSDLDNAFNEAAHSAFGLDNATDIRFSFDYGITDDITVGIGRSRYQEMLDGSVKWRFLHQTNKIPVTLTLFTDMGYTPVKTSELYSGIVKDFSTNELHRFNYFTQLIIGSKINKWLSLELLPSYLHRNFIKQSINPNNDAEDTNDLFSLGIGGRIKLTKRMCFIGDYFYTFSPYFQNNPNIFNPLALGFEIETGGHVFSIYVTNASAIIENNFIPYTTDTWTKGQIKFSFCISRTFAL